MIQKKKIIILVLLICAFSIESAFSINKQFSNGNMNNPIILKPYIEDGCKYVPSSDSTYRFDGLLEFDLLCSKSDNENQESDKSTPKEDLVIRPYIQGPKGYEQYKFPVTSIGSDVFYLLKYSDEDIDIEWADEPPTGASFLKSVVIPNTVTKIGSNAFRDCDSLTSVVIPKSVTSIGPFAFKNTPFMENLQKENPLVVINGILVDASTCKETKVTIPQGVTSIGENAFMECKTINSISIPKSVTHIESKAFLNCKNLDSVEIPSSVTSIDLSAFKNTRFLKNLQEQNPLVVVNGILIDATTYKEEKLVIPEGVARISHSAIKSAISDCRITSIVIPSSMKIIESNTFNDLYYLQSVTVQEGVRKIEPNAFANCRNLVHVEIKGTETVIDKNAFWGSSSIWNVVIPKKNVSFAEMLKQSCEKEVASVSGNIDKHDYVDLGLPSGRLWATCNLGANTYLEPGFRYAWGETQVKNKYEWSNYKWCNEKKKATKYCVQSDFGVVVDNKTQLEVADDAAYVNWGKSWRMPTMEEWKELMENCDWHLFYFYSPKYESKEAGMVGISRQNGNKIILPFGGTYFDGQVKNFNEGYYRSLIGEDKERRGDDYSGLHCSGVKLDDYKFHVTTLYRFMGHLVRAVVDDDRIEK